MTTAFVSAFCVQALALIIGAVTYAYDTWKGWKNPEEASSVCPHCELPPVMPEVCTPEINAVIERNIERDWGILNFGYDIGKSAGVHEQMMDDLNHGLESTPAVMARLRDYAVAEVEACIARVRVATEAEMPSAVAAMNAAGARLRDLLRKP